MFPRWHILLGIIFTAVIYITVPGIKPIYLILLFGSSFLIDIDHYICTVKNTKKLSLKNAFNHCKKLCANQKKEMSSGIRRKFPEFHFFHTIEFHILVGLASFFWTGFFYIFIGMIFHSLLDILSMIYEGTFHSREFFFLNWLRKKF